MKSLFSIMFFTISLSGFSQAIGSLNLNYLYNPQNEVDLQLKLVKEQNQIKVYYSFRVATVQFTPESCSITWQRKESFNQREGTSITPEEIQPAIIENGVKTGILSFPVPEKPWLLVAKVSNPIDEKSWVYFRTIEANYPVNTYLTWEGSIITKPFVSATKEYIPHGSGSGKPLRVFFYKHTFNPASPPFVESESTVDQFIFHDSTFTIEIENKIKFPSPGLYLLQEDTTGVDGISFRSTPDAYPKYTRVDDLVNPLVYVCTEEEFAELKNANGDKAKFDKVILSITRDKERAKNFMRNYFRNIEYANRYFSSYKEGWKTDRGMIFLIYGTPDEVIKTAQNETWNYKGFKQSFTFVKTGSVYDPDYYVLVREKRFSETWFSTIDLWRKSRF
ncbi:MAG: GWxTD domain-containing protein [Bacteroidia bacterium]|nr:GWxTD domain-containing protein [Bacteroidia bacterium]